MPRQPNHCGALKSPKNVASTFFNTVHLLTKDFRFEHRGAKLLSCPGRHLTSVRPYIEAKEISAQIDYVLLICLGAKISSKTTKTPPMW